MLRKLRKNYKRLVAFFLSAAMIISNVGGNVGTVFAAEEQEERESTIFMVDGQEILEAIQGLDGQEAFSKEDLEEMGLEVGRKGILKKYEKLLLPEKGKVYELALDIDTELALEGTALQAFYNTETKEVIFLYLNESSQAVDFYVNIDGYETKLVTVEANDANAAAGQPEAEEGKEEPEKSAGGTSGGGAGSTGESANDGSKDASETSEEGSKEAESTSGESASENESSGEAAEDGSKDDAPSAEQPEEKGTEDGSDKASEEGSKADESKEESKEGSDAEDKGKDESEDKGQTEDGTDSVKEDDEKSDPDKKETEDSKQEDGNTDTESNDKGNAGKPNDTASDDGGSKESGEAKEENGDKADAKDEGKSQEDSSKKDDADKVDQADGDSEDKGNAGSEGEKTSDDTAKEEDSADKSDDSSVKEDSADKAEADKPAKEESGDKAEDSGSSKGEDRSSDEGKSDSDGADSDSGDRHERNTLSLSMSIHQAAIVAIPVDEMEGEAEEEIEETTTAAEVTEEETEEKTTAAEVTEEETEETTTAAEVTEEETEEKTTTAAETEETAEKETTTAVEETKETVKEETKAAQPEETTETEMATETETAEAEKESEAETTVKAEEAAGETTEKAEDTSEEATEAKPEETTTEAAKAEGSGQGASDGAGNSSQEITDDWEIPGKAYDTVTIQETINARAYCVAIEDVKKIVEANQGIEAIEMILAAAKTYTAETDDAEFTVGVPEGAFAEEVELRAVKIEDEAQLKEMADQAEGALEEGKTVSGIVAYDLSFVSLVSGEEVEPAKAVSVNIRMKEPVALSQEDQAEENEADEGVSVVHLPDEGEAEVVAEAENGQETNFAFEAESFSEYVLVRTAAKAGVESESLEAAIQRAISENEGVLVLEQDYEESSVITEKESSLIKIERDLTIDLNGHKITYANEGTAAGKSFLMVNKGNLIIQDNSESQEGKITSTVNDLDALIRVESSGKLRVEGGTFETSGIRALFSTGKDAVINMTGGKITNCGGAGTWGAGVLVAGGSTFNMTGGEITENEGLYGGAISVSSSKANIGGQARITNNKATSGGGIVVYGTSKLTIGKGALISGNEATSYGGGIYAKNSDGKESTTIVDSSSIIDGADNVGAKAEISNNTAYAGAAVYGEKPCNVTIKENVIVSGNVSGNGKKAIQGTGTFKGISDNQSNYTFEEYRTAKGEAPYVINEPIVINLNGELFTYNGMQALFQIVNGGSLTILDEATDEMPVADGETSGEGKIVSGEQDLDSLVSVVTGGELTIAGGTLENKGGRAVLSEGGTVTMTGGHIKGSGVYDESGVNGLPGGGILLKLNGKFEMTGGSIEGNQGKLGGGIYANNSTVTITGDAEISGNKAANYGGGICALGNSKVTVSGNAKISSNIAYGKGIQGHGAYLGYEEHYGGGGIFGDKGTTITLKDNCVIDSNKSEATVPEEQRGGGYNGGGGIFSFGTVQMDGGTVSNNYAKDAGGGIYSAGNGKFKMSGGTISGNTAQNDEGGGLRVDGKEGEITGGKILNNTTNTTFDWGGGGIFVNSGAELTIKNLLVTGNTAAGFGGGVGGCSVGNVQVFDIHGAAIYGNTAGGTGLTQRANKIDDHTMKTEPIWSKFQNGYQDYYCAGVSTVHGKMLGGGDANWIGSYYKESPSKADASKKFDLNTEWGEIEICGDSSQTASGWMALTARPSKSDKDAAEKGATVEISGNTSATHGGGIMSNGKLILGDDPGSRPEKGSLVISKVAEEGAFSNNDLFKFTITLKDEGDSALSGDYPSKRFSSASGEAGVEENGGLSFTGGSATIELEAGKSLKIWNLPPGTKFTVTEADANVKYETTVDGKNGNGSEIKEVRKEEQDPSSVVIGGEGSIKGNSGSTVTFTNKPYTGDLEISKTVVSEGELTEKNKTDSFEFTITLKKDESPLAGKTYSYTGSAFLDGVTPPSPAEGSYTFNSNGQAKITLTHGQKITFTGIPAGTTYTVDEEAQDGYALSSNGSILNGEIKKAQTAVVGVENQVIPTGSLRISKTVVSNGNALTDSDKKAEFTFKVEFKDADENELIGEYPYTGNESGTISSGDKVILKHGQEIAIGNLPKGTHYTVWEVKTEAAGGYTADIKVAEGVTKVNATDDMLVGGTGIIDSNSEAAVEFINTVNTGSLSIQKTVIGAVNKPEDTFAFVVKLTKDDQPLTGSYPYVGSSTESGINAPENKELNLDEEGKGTIRLMHGQKITISDLPVGTVYQVEEMPYDGYKVILPDNTQGTIAEKDGEITVAFTNQMETGKLSIQKIVTGEKGDKTKDFNFTITLTKDGKPLTGTYPYTGIAFKEDAESPSSSQGRLTLVDGQVEISLKHGQRITLSGIPAGTSYTVTEREAGQDGYTTNKTDAEGTIVNDGEKTAEFVNNKPDTPEESTTETESTTEPDTSESESTTEPSTSETEPTTEPSTTPEESSPTEEPTTPQEPTTPEPTPSESPENPTTPSRPSGGGGRDRDRNPSVTPEPTPIPQEEVPLANIDPENVPLAMMPSENPTETMVIDDESVPLFGLPKTGDRSASTGALLGVMLLSLMAACGIHMKKRKEEE